MPTPSTIGQLKSKLSDMEIGDYIICATSMNPFIVFRDLGNADKILSSMNGIQNELPITGGKYGDITQRGYFYFIKVAKGLLVADRVTMNSVAWDALNSSFNGSNTRYVQGLPVDFGNIIPTMTSNTSPDGEVIFSNQQTGFEAYRAFDKLLGNNQPWMTNNSISTGWLGFKFNEPKIVKKYSVTSRTNNSTYPNTPNTWTFEGSNDGDNWDVLDNQTNITNWVSTGEKKSFLINNSEEYLFYRINITKANSSLIAIAELEMFDTIGIIRSLTGGVTFGDANGNKSLTDQGHGAWPTNNEWDKYIVNFPQELIQNDKTLDDIFHFGVKSWTQDTSVNGMINPDNNIGNNTRRIVRGFNGNSQFTMWHTSNVSSTDLGFRPVFEYQE